MRLMIIKKSVIVLLLLLTQALVKAQEINGTVYKLSMDAYKNKDYKEASKQFSVFLNNKGFEYKANIYYNGACIYALNEQIDEAFKLLEYSIENKFYANYNHISSDPDLECLYASPKWKALLKKVQHNIDTKPERTKQKVKAKLYKAKKILNTDNGKLWGEQIWCDNILVLAENNTVYSITPFPECKTDSSGVYFNTFPKNTFSYSNSAQEFRDEKYAVVMTSYLDRNLETIIHELFHILQYKHRKFNGNAVNYLDNYDARQWLRLEYHALRNCLNTIIKNSDRTIINASLNDAMIYRKIRQTTYKAFLQDEIELETLEGLAAYTGYKLSTYPNKYEKAIAQINEREKANTYTRPFPYATGLAYGLIFDFLEIDWKYGLDATYNFLEIYESKYLFHAIDLEKVTITTINSRNNYEDIHYQELERQKDIEHKTAVLKKKLIESPTLSVSLKDKKYRKTMDMNGTLVLKDIGVVYTTLLKGVDTSGNNFGNFTFKAKSSTSENEITGVLNTLDGTRFIFAMPIKIEGHIIKGEHYKIELNENWIVKQKNENGDFEIVEKQ